MSRIQIDFPDKVVFETQVRVRINDINYGGHAGHDALISILHEARVRCIESMGFHESDVDGKAIILSDIAVSYKSTSFLGDTLNIEISAGDFEKKGCDLYYRATNSTSRTLVLLAKTGLVFLDPVQKNICPVPGPFLAQLT